MKKLTPFFALVVFVLSTSCIIVNTQPDECEVVTVKITKIKEGPSYDIVFYGDGTNNYYINRGLEQGLNLDSLNAKVLNKTVTLHLAKLFYGTSKHIAQMAINDEVIFTEFD
ncbi:MAG: hypothetical protein KDD03_00910 [Gelidibacter sp.]|nr:hypothetical protein [Gelidibacter sp.]